MDRARKNKPLLQHATSPFPELTEKEMYEKRYKAMLESKKPKKPPKISREKVFDEEPSSTAHVFSSPEKVDPKDVFVSMT